MYTFIVSVHVVVCVFLVLVVLLQAGRSDMSGLTGGGQMQTNWGAPQQTTLLGKITSGAAVVFMVTSLSLAWITNDNARAGSVIEDDLLNELEQESKAADPVPAPEAAASAPEVAPPAAPEAAPAPDAAAPAPGGEAAPAPGGEAAPAPVGEVAPGGAAPAPAAP